MSEEEIRPKDSWAKVKQRLKANRMAKLFAKALRKKMGVDIDYRSDSS